MMLGAVLLVIGAFSDGSIRTANLFVLILNIRTYLERIKCIFMDKHNVIVCAREFSDKLMLTASSV